MDTVTLRPVVPEDLPIFFEHQREPEANRMTGFPPRDWDAFNAHWARIQSNPAVINRTILYNGRVAGNIAAYDMEGKREVGYWLGQEFWGKGIATRALAAFLEVETRRPLYAHVALRNPASRRVLEKCGFSFIGEDYSNPVEGEAVEEVILVLA